MMMMLDQYTPSDVDLSSNVTQAECWEQLDNKYANPTVVCSHLMNEYLEWKPESRWSKSTVVLKVADLVNSFYKDLRAIDKQGELINGELLINHSVKCLPQYDKEEIIKLRTSEDKKPPNVRRSAYEIISGYLKETKEGLEKYGCWINEKEVAAKDKDKRIC